jgi:hypothetical protein
VNLFAGAGHIKFWKMGRTFTGLKLTGSLGRFGRTEISDIIGFLALPDGKVFVMKDHHVLSGYKMKEYVTFPVMAH